MQLMFGDCSNLINTKNVTNMAGMFSGCNKLENINLFSFNTRNVTYMFDMFSDCYNLTNLDLSSFNTQNVIKMDRMFNNCKKLGNIKTNKKYGEKITNEIK